MLVASVNEYVHGVKNLYRSSTTKGNKEYPNYVKYMAEEWLKVLIYYLLFL